MAEITPEQLGARIRVLRKRANLSQEAVAESIRIDAKSLSRIEGGKHFPSLETLGAIAEALNVPMTEFFVTPKGKETPAAMRAYLADLSQSLDDDELFRAVRAVRQALTNP